MLYFWEAIRDYERFLQRLAYPAKDADSLCDVLRGLGDLSLAELAERATSAEEAKAWITRLEHEHRVFQVRVQREVRYIAVEDAARYRDALGIVPAPGTPTAFLEPVTDAVGQLIARYACTHGTVPGAALERSLHGLSAQSISEVVAANR